MDRVPAQARRHGALAGIDVVHDPVGIDEDVEAKLPEIFDSALRLRRLQLDAAQRIGLGIEAGRVEVVCGGDTERRKNNRDRRGGRDCDLDQRVLQELS